MNSKAIILLLTYGGLIVVSAVFLGSVSSRPHSAENGILLTFMWAIPTGIYLLPTFIEALRDTADFIFIFLANIFGGWTGIGWLGCLLWAVVDSKKQDPIVVQQIIYQQAPPVPVPVLLPKDPNEAILRIVGNVRCRRVSLM